MSAIPLAIPDAMPTSTTDPRLRRDWFLFTLLTFLFSFGFAIYSGVFQNFLRDQLHSGPLELGGLESMREIPGLLAALMAGTLVALAESHIVALCGLFLIDNVLFSFGVGFSTYLQRIAPSEDLTPCLAMGVTMNHIAAVAVPVGGAYLWQHFHNYQLPFWVGVAVACVSLVATRTMDV